MPLSFNPFPTSGLNEFIQPFTTPFEMADANAEAVLAKLKQWLDVAEFQSVFGADSLSDAPAAAQPPADNGLPTLPAVLVLHLRVRRRAELRRR